MKEIILCLVILVECSSLLMGQVPVLAPSTYSKFSALPVGSVKVQGEIGRRIDLLWKNEISGLDLDDYVLKYFATKHQNSEAYRGLGKLLHAHVLYAFYSKDKDIIERKNYLLNETLKIQDADGYIGLMSRESRLFQGYQGLPWDAHEVSYIINALCANYTYFDDRKSLEAARKAADYIINNWKRKSEAWKKPLTMQESMLFTGLEEAMVAVYDLTRDKKYLNFLLDQRDLDKWDLDIEVGRGPLNRGHVYSYLVRALAQLKLYAIEPSRELLGQSHKALDFMIDHYGMTITGGSGQKENWDDSQDGRGSLAESCATIHFIWLCDQLLQLTGEPYFGDLMERAIYNALFGALSPDCRLTRYYTPFEGDREYWTGGSYCCNNNLRKMMPTLPGMVYYQNEKGVMLNLYTQSEGTIQLASGDDLTIRQTTSYPTDGIVKIELFPERPQTFDLMMRIPSWSKTNTLKINGKIVEAAAPGALLIMSRVWKPKDVVEISFEMDLRLIKGVLRQAGRVALMRGPVVYCLGSENAGEYGGLDGATLGQITLNPRSFKLQRDSTVRPNGTAYSVEIWPPGDERRQAVNLPTVTLSEFPDPNGKAVYFKLFHFDYFEDADQVQSDELFSSFPAITEYTSLFKR